ncbi:MAG: HesA/MoeB/ThiF family protein [Desulfobacula sp.]|nr:HesA/MoeB/ThiF family protein [Desulfobacula sp.]
MGKKQFKERYDRNFNTLSNDDQKKLGFSRVAVIGLGGLGGGVCEMLARIGVGHLTLIDGDSFEPSNLNRQLLSQENLMGVPKAKVAKNRINSVNSEVNVEYFVEYLDESNMYDKIKTSDLVVDCLDTIDTRFILQDAANKASIPIVSGAIAGMTGQVTSIFPGDAGYRLIYGDDTDKQSRGVETMTGNIGCCAIFVAALQSSEVLKILLNRKDLLRNKLLISDLWTNTFEIVDLI